MTRADPDMLALYKRHIRYLKLLFCATRNSC